MKERIIGYIIIVVLTILGFDFINWSFDFSTTTNHNRTGVILILIGGVILLELLLILKKLK